MTLTADRSTLLNIRPELDPTDRLNWAEDTPKAYPELWQGVRWDNADKRVNSIRLGPSPIHHDLPTLPPLLAQKILSLFPYFSAKISRAKLSGTPPPELGKLTSLQYLDLSHNRLTGHIPPELGNLANLQGLYLNDNELTGPIPKELGKLSKLMALVLWDNPRLYGDIPQSLLDLPTLAIGITGTDITPRPT